MSKHINKASMGIPMYAINGGPILQLFSEKELIIEGAESLVYYDESVVKIRTKNMILSASGNAMSIKCLANDNIAICGIINNICLEHIK